MRSCGFEAALTPVGARIETAQNLVAEALARLLSFVLCAVILGCSPRAPAEVPAPIHRPAIEQIPVDLDVVVRVDLDRIRQAIDPGLSEVLGRLLLSQARAPEEVLAAALAKTNKIWLGFRPDADPRRWDNVVILEGNFADIGSDKLAEAFGPPRDLGGGFRAYDDPQPAFRTSPARLYTYLEERWLLASSAEVDALERVIERHQAERTLEPPETGVVSMAANLSRLSTSLAASSPRAADLLERAESLSGFIKLSRETMNAEVRLRFTDASDAQVASAALQLFLRVYTVSGLSIKAESHERDLVIRAEGRTGALEGWLALSAPQGEVELSFASGHRVR